MREHFERDRAVLRGDRLPDHRRLDRPCGREGLTPVALRAFVSGDRRGQPAFGPVLHLLHPPVVARRADASCRRREGIAQAAVLLRDAVGGLHDEDVVADSLAGDDLPAPFGRCVLLAALVRSGSEWLSAEDAAVHGPEPTRS